MTCCGTCRLQEIAAGLLVDREKADGGAVFGRHIRDGRAIRQRQIANTGAEELDEFSDDLGLAQQFGDVQNKVRRRHAGVQRADHVDADDVRREEVDGLPKHRRLGFNAADTPADHAQPGDHSGVGIRADQSVRETHAILEEDAAGEKFEIDLMQDTGAGREQAGYRDKPASPISRS